MELTAVPGAPEGWSFGVGGWFCPVRMGRSRRDRCREGFRGFRAASDRRRVLAGGTRATGDYIEEIGTSFVTGQEVRFDPVDPLAIPGRSAPCPMTHDTTPNRWNTVCRSFCRHLRLDGRELISGGEPLEEHSGGCVSQPNGKPQRSFWDSELGGLGGEVSKSAVGSSLTLSGPRIGTRFRTRCRIGCLALTTSLISKSVTLLENPSPGRSACRV